MAASEVLPGLREPGYGWHLVGGGSCTCHGVFRAAKAALILGSEKHWGVPKAVCANMGKLCAVPPHVPSGKQQPIMRVAAMPNRSLTSTSGQSAVQFVVHAGSSTCLAAASNALTLVQNVEIEIAT